jgi:hypothetical protein
MKILLLAVLVLSGSVGAADTPSPAAAVVGRWEGESICTVKDSPCHDEHVVYEISPSAGRLKMDGYKIVKGEKEFMGSLTCTFDAATSTLHCANPGEWNFHLTGTHMDGTLHLTDVKRTLFRRISVDKR